MKKGLSLIGEKPTWGKILARQLEYALTPFAAQFPNGF